MSNVHRTTVSRRRALKTGALAALTAGLMGVAAPTPAQAAAASDLDRLLSAHPEMASALNEWAREMQPAQIEPMVNVVRSLTNLLVVTGAPPREQR